MIETRQLLPGVTLRCFRDSRFKQSALSIQFLRRMCKEEAAKNALVPAVLLRGTEEYPDMRAITLHLDDLYGSSVSALVRRVGDYQTTGFSCAFMEDRYALSGDKILEPMVKFLQQLLFRPIQEDGGFCRDFVEGEKKNLIATIESEKNDKRVYASAKLLRSMCKGDTFGLPRLGEVEDVEKVDHCNLYTHYKKVLAESPVELFYVGSAAPEEVASILTECLAELTGIREKLPAQTALQVGQSVHLTETMDVTQGKLCMGFVTPVTNREPEFAAMQVMNTVFGGGMTSKLFMNVREKLSLCYSVGSGYYGTKGLMTVSAGIDTDKEETARREILAQLQACRDGEISQQELSAAKEAILSSLRTIHDSPGNIEGYYSTTVLSGLAITAAEHATAVSAVTAEDVAAVANKLSYHSSFFLKGEGV